MIRVEKLNKTYDRYRRHANHVLKDVSFELPQTGFVCILGPSGCGKTSLLNAIGGLDRFDGGLLATDRVCVNRYGSREYEAERNRNFGYIFQNYYLLPEHSVAYNIYLGLHSLDLSHKEKLQRIRQALQAVDMSRYIRRKVGELSGGQQQRIAIARALARRPRVIFADEPTGNLDEANTMNICSLLRRISKTSLVIMVTHEERIAHFFADRIITLEQGRIESDCDSWQRDPIFMGSEKDLYAGDYAQRELKEEGISLRLLTQEGADPVEVTVVALKDRIVVKLADSRAVICSQPGEFPVLKEGKRPVLTLETVDRSQSSDLELASEKPTPAARAGHGIRFGMMLKEAFHLNRGGGGKRLSMRIFLVLLTLLTVWTVSDYLTVSAVDPRDFITSDSHVLKVKLERGEDAGGYYVILWDVIKDYLDYLEANDLPADYIPQPISPVSYKLSIMPQMESVELFVKNFSYAPVKRLDPDSVILGRMPKSSGEIVVDRWVLEKLIQSDSIVKNALSDPEFFLGESLYFSRCNVYLTIVGICDSGEPSIYLTDTDTLRLTSVVSTPMTLSEFKAAHPGEYDDIVLPEGGCIVNAAAAGSSYLGLVGYSYVYNTQPYEICHVVQTSDPAKIIVNDDVIEQMLRKACSNLFYLYCEDKAAVKEFLRKEPEGALKGMLIIDVFDDNSTAWAAYTEASTMKINARTIVTATVILLSMAMLYLLCRSQAQERLGMLAVYRLLGIPRRKLAAIFAIESILLSLQTALPAAVAVYLLITVGSGMEELEMAMLLPWQAALAAYGCILGYHILVALLPLRKLLYMPPAQLAAKYDY